MVRKTQDRVSKKERRGGGEQRNKVEYLPDVKRGDSPDFSSTALHT